MFHPTWKFVAASIPGTAHTKAGIPCEDAYEVQQGDYDTLIAIITDGASSALYGREAAIIVRDTVSSWLEERISIRSVAGTSDDTSQLDGSLTRENAPDEQRNQLFEEPSGSALIPALKEAVNAARRALEAAAIEYNVDIREFSATVIACIFTTRSLAYIFLGDSAAVCLYEDNTLETICKPMKGEYVNQTVFLSSSEWEKHIQSGVIDQRIRGVMIFSDGIQPLAMRLIDHTPHPGFFLPLFAFLHEATDENRATTELKEFLSSDRVQKRTDDDISLIIALKRTPGSDSITTSNDM